MVNKGIVKNMKDGYIEVHLYRDSACAHCSGCGSSSKMGSFFKFKSDQKLTVGDVVTFEIEDASLLNIAALVYLMPIIFMIAGYFFGQNIGFSENYCVFMSFISLAFSFGLICFFDRKRGKKLIDQKIKVISIDKPDPETEIKSCSLER